MPFVIQMVWREPKNHIDLGGRGWHGPEPLARDVLI